MASQLNETTLHSTGIFFTADRITFIKTPIFTFVFIMGMFGNIALITATAKFKSLRKPTNILIGLLCIYDLIILVLGIPVYLMDSSNMLKVCRVSKPIHVMIVTSIVITLLTIAFERYTFIVHPLKRNLKFTAKKLMLFVIVLNFLSLFSGLPVMFSLISNPELCSGVWVQSMLTSKIAMLILHYVIPMAVMLYLYSMCWYCIRKENGNSIRINGTHFNATYIPSNQCKKYSIEQNCVDDARETCEDGFLSPNIPKSDNNPPYSPFMPHGRQSRSERRNSVTVGALKPRSCSVVSTQSVDRHTGLSAAPRNIIRSLGTSFSQTQRSVTSLILGVEIEVPTEFSDKRSNQTLLTLKMFVYIIVVFGVCMLPHHLLTLIPYHQGENKICDIFNIFIYVNATSNPYVYGFMNRDYIIGLRKLFWTRDDMETSYDESQPQENLIADKNSSSDNPKECNLRYCVEFVWKWLARYRSLQTGNKVDRPRKKSTSSNNKRRVSTRENCIQLTDTTKHLLTPLPIIIISPSCEEHDESCTS